VTNERKVAQEGSNLEGHSPSFWPNRMAWAALMKVVNLSSGMTKKVKIRQKVGQLSSRRVDFASRRRKVGPSDPSRGRKVPLPGPHPTRGVKFASQRSKKSLFRGPKEGRWKVPGTTDF